MGTVGQPVLRKEGSLKLRGAAKYIDDIGYPDMLFGATVRSSVPRGRLLGVHLEGNLPWDDIVVVCAADIPGKNGVALLDDSQPYLVSEHIRHPEEPVLLLAHADRYLLEEARRCVRLEVEPLPPVLSIQEALTGDERVYGADNVLQRITVTKGDLEAAFASSDLLVVEGEYHTGAQEQLYIEPNGVIATYGPNGAVRVEGSLQCPYYVHGALMALFNLPAHAVQVVQWETGGGFGGKEEYPNLIAGHAALLAMKSGKPVKLIYDRAEDMVATTKRHPSRTRHRTAVTRDGTLVAMDIDFVLDGGAYMTLSPVVLSRGTIHAAGPYRCPNVRIRASAVATNHPPHGAFRGFGAPQSIFALERHLDGVAKALGMTPEALRVKNFLHQGDTTATGQQINEAPDLPALMAKAFTETDYERKRQSYPLANVGQRMKRGIGFASFMHGSGFTGSGEQHLASRVSVQANPNGTVTVLAASTEIGQGTNTIFAQIVADALKLPYEAVHVAQPDTAQVPNSGPTVASRTCMVVGELLEKACASVLEILRRLGGLDSTYDQASFGAAVNRYIKNNGPLVHTAQYTQPTDVRWDDVHYRGDAYAAYAWAVYVAEVEVDTVTYETRVLDFVAVQEVGRVIHPTLAAGQIEGGVAQALGFALYEKVVWNQGRMANGRMTNYIIPTSADVPPIRVFFHEQPGRFGPGGGAKGIGELPMDGGAPAVLAAVEHATGAVVRAVPMLPEDLMAAMEGT